MTAGGRSKNGRGGPRRKGAGARAGRADAVWSDPAWAFEADAPSVVEALPEPFGDEASPAADSVSPLKSPAGDASPAGPEPVKSPEPPSRPRRRRASWLVILLVASAGARWAYVEVAYHELRSGLDEQGRVLEQSRSDLGVRELQLDALTKRVEGMTAELRSTRAELAAAKESAAKAQADAAQIQQQSAAAQADVAAARAAADAHAEELDDARQRALKGALDAARAEACEQRVAELERARGRGRPRD